MANEESEKAASVECKNLKVLPGHGKSRKGKVQLTSK